MLPELSSRKGLHPNIRKGWRGPSLLHWKEQKQIARESYSSAKEKTTTKGFPFWLRCKRQSRKGEKEYPSLSRSKRKEKDGGNISSLRWRERKRRGGGNPSLSHRKILKKMTEENENACLCGRPSLSFQECPSQLIRYDAWWWGVGSASGGWHEEILSWDQILCR